MQEHPIIRQVHTAVRRALSQGVRVVVAVSGGADSLALAAAVHALVQKGFCQATVVHVEHGLRGPESLRDAALVEAFCAQRQLPFLCRHVQVPQLVEQAKLSVEDAARQLRYQALWQAVTELQADFLLTAHHRDDQAETLMLKLLRGSGLDGLAAMRPRQGRLLRPLLGLPRAVLEEYCRLEGLNYCYDSSNSDLHYSRNRLRQELLPYLEEHFNPQVKQQLARTAGLLQEDASCLEQLAAELLARLGRRVEQGWQLEVAQWGLQPAALRKRVLRQAYFQLTQQALSHALTESLDALCLAGSSGRSLALPQGLQAAYAYGILTVGRPIAKPVVTSFKGQLLLGRPLELAGHIYLARLVRGNYPGLQLPGLIYPWKLLQGKSLYVRSRQPGDRFQPYGGAGGKKLKDYLIDKKIPRSAREGQALLCTETQVLGIFALANGSWPGGAYDQWLLVERR